VSARYRGRLRGPDAGRLMLAIILVVLTTLVAMRGSISDRGATYAASAASTVHAAVASP
jgi:hypothetical protein